MRTHATIQPAVPNLRLHTLDDDVLVYCEQILAEKGRALCKTPEIIQPIVRYLRRCLSRNVSVENMSDPIIWNACSRSKNFQIESRPASMSVVFGSGSLE